METRCTRRGQPVNFGELFKWEWLIIEVIVLGILVRELVSVNREIRQARETERSRAAQLSGDASETAASTAPTANETAPATDSREPPS